MAPWALLRGRLEPRDQGITGGLRHLPILTRKPTPSPFSSRFHHVSSLFITFHIFFISSLCLLYVFFLILEALEAALSMLSMLSSQRYVMSLLLVWVNGSAAYGLGLGSRNHIGQHSQQQPTILAI